MGSRYSLLTNFLDYDVLQRALAEIEQLELARYDNPFERKSFLEKKSQLSFNPSLNSIFQILTDSQTCRWVQSILGIPISHADIQQYGGVFVYHAGDYLAPHTDAGIHPHTEQRKVATALMYLTLAELEFYKGDRCTQEDPVIYSKDTINLNTNDLVLFKNTDDAWHGVPVVRGNDRVVVTISYMAPDEFSHPSFRNLRTRAYFGRALWDRNYNRELAEQRASEGEHERVYRYEA